MTPIELKKYIAARYKAGINRALYLEGSPGLGKTMLPAQAAKELGIGFMQVHAPLLQPEDYGFPVITASRDDVNFIVSQSKFPLVGSDCPEQGIFLIDELPQCDASAQKILANLVQEREIHGQHIKPGWMIVATGNRTSDRSGANRLLGHLANKITRVTFEPSLNDWCLWALDNAVSTELIAFLRFRPELLNAYDAQHETNPTPRAWVLGVNSCIGKIDAAHEFESFKGDVGEGAAAEFLAFLKIYRKLPSVDAVLLNPDKAECPNDPATQYAITGAIAAQTNATNFSRALQYMSRMPEEFSILYVRDCMARKDVKDAIVGTREFTEWAVKSGHKLI